MFQFYMPWFALLLPLPFFFKWKEEAYSLELYFPSLERLRKNFPASQTGKKQSNDPYFFLLGSWILLILSLMQPEKVEQFKQVHNKGYDLMLAVDISGSMQAVDFSTSSKIISRLDATKEVVGKFTLGRQGDRLGLITFGDHAYLHVPLTLDTVSVSRMLNNTVFGMAGNGTAIGDAIGLGVKTLRNRAEGSRVLILLTDGEDNASRIPPLEAAKLAKQYGIRIYTIGVGKNGQAPFPNGAGGYVMANLSIDEALLKQIAEETGGTYFSATNKKALESIYNQINELEKTDSDTSVLLIREPLYQYPLCLAMILLFLLSIYQLKRRLYGT